MLVSGYNNIIVLPNCTMLYYVFSGPLSLRSYAPEIKFNNNIQIISHMSISLPPQSTMSSANIMVSSPPSLFTVIYNITIRKVMPTSIEILLLGRFAITNTEYLPVVG